MSTLHTPTYTRIGNFVIILHRATTHTNSSDQMPCSVPDGYSTGESDKTTIRVFDAVQTATGLRNLEMGTVCECKPGFDSNSGTSQLTTRCFLTDQKILFLAEVIEF